MKLSINFSLPGHADYLSGQLARDQHEFHEYSFLNGDQLSDYFINRSKKLIETPDAIALSAVNNDSIEGFLICLPDEFDSTFFGIPCYKIVDIKVIPDDPETVKVIVNKLLNKLEILLKDRNKKTYITFSLNNNLRRSDVIFNSLTKAGYYYIHTLLTFSSIKKKFKADSFYPDENIRIRKAVKEDAKRVSEIAGNTFRYSRFHLDPFLDNNKASKLLMKSAENSILENFVDIMYVAEVNGVVAGYYSAKKKYEPEFSRTIGHVVISAVDENMRGLGLFSKMDSHILNWFADFTDFAEMGTYLGNFPVHKTWINKGLSLVRGTHQFSKLLGGSK